MAHAIRFPSGTSHDSIDGGRIAANTGTLLINGALVLALLVPLSQQAALAPTERDEAIQMIPILKIKPVDPPPPKRVEIAPPRPVATTQPLQPPQPVAQVEQQVVESQPGDIAITAPDVAKIDSMPAHDSIAPLSSAQLQALTSPPPPYPAEALRAGASGTVELEILVGVDGRALDVRVVRSSGNRALDQSARRTVLTKWTFVPAMRDGRAVQALGRVPIEFVM
jgi:protein TonB